MPRFFLPSALAVAAAIPGIAHAQGVDYHKAQQAGKVWGDKIGQNDSVSEAELAEWRKPVTEAERQAVLKVRRADYDELLRSVGRKNADRWLDMTAKRYRKR